MFARELTASPAEIDSDRYGFERKDLRAAKDWSFDTEKAKWALDEADWTLHKKEWSLAGPEWKLDREKQGKCSSASGV